MFSKKDAGKSTAKKPPEDKGVAAGLRPQGASADATPRGAAAGQAGFNYGALPYRRQEVRALEEKFGVRRIQGMISALFEERQKRRGYTVDDAIDSVIVDMSGGLDAERPVRQHVPQRQAGSRNYGPHRREEMAQLEQRFGGLVVGSAFDTLTHEQLSPDGSGSVVRPAYEPNDAIDLVIQRLTRNDPVVVERTDGGGLTGGPGARSTAATASANAGAGTGTRPATASGDLSRLPQEADVRALEAIHGQAKAREMRQRLHDQGHSPAEAVKILLNRMDRFGEQGGGLPRSAQARPQPTPDRPRADRARPEDTRPLVPPDAAKVGLFKKLFHQSRGGGDSAH